MQIINGERILSCEGYKMFYGDLEITPMTGEPKTFENGTFLYKPEYDTWYGLGRSFPNSIVSKIIAHADSWK